MGKCGIFLLMAVEINLEFNENYQIGYNSNWGLLLSTLR